jgi:hypothetical protein
MNSIKKNNMNNMACHTIDKKHSEMIEHFSYIENDVIPKLIEEKAQLKERARRLNDSQIEEYMELRDRIKSITTEIKNLKIEKKNYLLDNSKYIFNYFEEKKKISSGEAKNVNVLNSFFKIKENSDDNQDKMCSLKNSIQNYWKNVSNEIINIGDFSIATDICNFCSKGEMIPQDEEGVLICNNQKCGKFINYIIDSSKPSNKEPPNEVSYTAYIRLNHFKEILSQFQAKETTQIPESVIEDIRNRIKKERISNLAEEINYDKMRDILRKLGYNKYFEHIQYINSIFGIRPPIMSEELHETLCVLFIEIQKPWAIHCPVNRTNFFNYTYTLYQLCVLLDQTQYLPYIPLMKDHDKQLEQDLIWRKVCKDLDWEYHPTV